MQKNLAYFHALLHQAVHGYLQEGSDHVSLICIDFWLLNNVILLKLSSDAMPELKNIDYNSKAVRFDSSIDLFTFLPQLSS